MGLRRGKDPFLRESPINFCCFQTRQERRLSSSLFSVHRTTFRQEMPRNPAYYSQRCIPVVGPKQKSLFILSSLCFLAHGRHSGYVPTAVAKKNFLSTRDFPFDKHRENLSLLASPSMMNDPKKRDSPSAQRNRAPIWNVLSAEILGPIVETSDAMNVLEIAAGSGVHTEFFASRLQKMKEESSSGLAVKWYATDPDQESRASIECYIQDASLEKVGVQSPLPLTLNAGGIMEAETRDLVVDEPLQVIICINMIHISPWDATLGLFCLASEHLDTEHGRLFCYGPYKEGGTAVESNL